MKAAQLERATSGDTVEVTLKNNPIAILREILEVQRESYPTLDVDAALAFAIKNPDNEVVDSLGAVSVACITYGAYSPDNLIPNDLLTHENFSTLNGLRRVIKELDKRPAKK